MFVGASVKLSLGLPVVAAAPGPGGGGCGEGAGSAAGQSWVLLLLSIPARRARAARNCSGLLVLFCFFSLDLKHVVSGWS